MLRNKRERVRFSLLFLVILFTLAGSCNNNDDFIEVTEEPDPIIIVSSPEDEFAEFINEYIQRKNPESPLVNLGNTFVEEGRMWNVDPRLVVAIAGHETDFGETGYCESEGLSSRETHNAWGWGGPCNSFDSWEIALRQITSSIDHGNNYFSQGRDTVEKMAPKYCPETSDPRCAVWAEKVTFFLLEMCGDPEKLTYPENDLDLECKPDQEVASITIENTSTPIRKPGAMVLGVDIDDSPISIRQTNDGGNIILGWSITTERNTDAWVVKLDAQRELEWARSYGGEGYEHVWSPIYQTVDGGYVFAGESDSFSDDKGDGWIVKLDPNGSIEWQKIYSVDGVRIRFYGLNLTDDGGYIALGEAPFSQESFVLKLDNHGDIEWQQVFMIPPDFYHLSRSILQTEDKGFIFARVVWYQQNTEISNVQITKLGQDGEVLWEKALDGFPSFGGSLAPANDGGFVFVNYLPSSSQSNLVKFSSDGEMVWQKSYSGFRHVDSVISSGDGGFVLVGSGDPVAAEMYPIRVFKVDTNGNLEWNKTVSLSSKGYLSLDQTDNGYVILAGINYFSEKLGDVLVTWIGPIGEIALSNCEPVESDEYSVDASTTSAVVNDAVMDRGEVLFEINSSWAEALNSQPAILLNCNNP